MPEILCGALTGRSPTPTTAIGPFAVESGLILAGEKTTTVRIGMVNTNSVATATFATPGGRVDYDGDVAVEPTADGWQVTRSAAIRTARKIFDGAVFARPRL